MEKLSYFITTIFTFVCLSILTSCGQANVNESNNKETSVPVEVTKEKGIKLKIASISIVSISSVENQKEYKALTRVQNIGDTIAIATQYSVVISWRCPTDLQYIHDTPMPPQAGKPIKPGQTVLVDFILPFSCRPRPIVIPCVFYLIRMPSANEKDTIYDEKRLDYTLR